jgi:hypothetical protein
MSAVPHFWTVCTAWGLAFDEPYRGVGGGARRVGGNAALSRDGDAPVLARDVNGRLTTSQCKERSGRF